MIERAVFLRKAVDIFTRSNQQDFNDYILSNKEWGQAEILLSILLPFKLVSDHLEQTTRPSIERVFWSYETMFNQVDTIETKLSAVDQRREPWIKELIISFDSLTRKLRDYYAKTHEAFVYADGVLLNPWIKAGLFKNPSWKDDTRNWAEEYIGNCRTRYINYYETLTHLIPHSSGIGQKRKHAEFTHDFESFIEEQARQQTKNEFDHYMSLPPPSTRSGTTLEWWHRNSKEYPRLARMAQDILAVPCTGAGVERIFSIARRVAISSRASLDPSTIQDTMMFKNHPMRHSQPLQFDKYAGLMLGEDLQGDDEESPGSSWRPNWWTSSFNH